MANQKFDNYDDMAEDRRQKRWDRARRQTADRIADLARGFADQPLLDKTEWSEANSHREHVSRFRDRALIPELQAELERGAALEARARARMSQRGLDPDEVELNLFAEIKRDTSG